MIQYFNSLAMRTAAVLLLVAANLTGVYAAPVVEKGPLLATVAGEPIYARDVISYAKANPLMSGYITHEAGFRRVVDDMINYQLLKLEGKRVGMSMDPDEKEDRYILRVKDKFVQKCERLDEAGSKKFYEQHPELFSTPAYARLSKAYLKKSDSIDGVSSSEFLTEQAESLRSGKIEFDAVVAKIRPKVHADIALGDIGFMPLAEPDPIIDLVKAASIGDVVGPVERDGNIFIFLVTERREPVQLKWEEVLADAQDAAYSYCMQDNYANLRKEMEKHFPVVIYDENFRSLQFY